jgi:putative transposase
MIDRPHELLLTRQGRILELACSTAYYQPAPIPPEDLALMRRIDELHMEMPYAGARMLSRLLKREGQPVGRKHVSTLMQQRMDIHALYRKPNTSKRNRHTRPTPICCAIWRLPARTTSGRRTSPTSR